MSAGVLDSVSPLSSCQKGITPVTTGMIDRTLSQWVSWMLSYRDDLSNLELEASANGREDSVDRVVSEFAIGHVEHCV